MGVLQFFSQNIVSKQCSFSYYYGATIWLRFLKAQDSLVRLVKKQVAAHESESRLSDSHPDLCDKLKDSWAQQTSVCATPSTWLIFVTQFCVVL